ASQLLMAAVAHGPIAGALAGAEPGLLRLLRLPLDRRKPRALVRAVAERLALRAAAGRTTSSSCRPRHRPRAEPVRRFQAVHSCRRSSRFGRKPRLAAGLGELAHA